MIKMKRPMTKCWCCWGCGVIETFIHGWLGVQISTAILKYKQFHYWTYVQKSECSVYEKICMREKKKKAHSSFIHSGPKLDINQVSMNRMRDKETVANSHTGILHSNEKLQKSI